MKNRTLLILEQSDLEYPKKYYREASEASAMAEIVINPGGKVVKNSHGDHFQKSHTKTLWMRVRAAIRESKRKNK